MKRKLNLKYYKGHDDYSDGDVESKIIELIRKYPNNYEEVLKQDCSWPVYYHLSTVRQNIINWYPFEKESSILEIGAGMGAITEYLCQCVKNVTCVESSKTRATAILERTKNFKNVDIIVGNFNDIIIRKKFDYIILIGVFEYAEMFKTNNKEDAYKEFLLKLKKLLKPNGKILIAIENRFGLKYWCGAYEDHTNIIYHGINNYPNNERVKTFSKNDLENMFKEIGFFSNFYYPLPDYKFPEYIITDENKNDVVYTPYYFQKFKMFANEKDLFKDIIKNNVLSFFANSYFIELSLKASGKKVSYVKNNSTRVNEYRTQTYEKNGRFYKKPLNIFGRKHIQNILNYNKVLASHNINTVEIKEELNTIYTDYCNAPTLDKILSELYINGDFNTLYKLISNYINFLKINFKKENIENVTTIFEKYHIEIDENTKNELYFIKDGFIDLIFQNILFQDDKYKIIDQEWYEEYVPLEYIVFRAINLFVRQTLFNIGFLNQEEIINNIFSNLNINLKKYLNLFEQIEKNFLKKVFGENVENNCYSNYTAFIDYKDKIDESIKYYDNKLIELSQKNDIIKEKENLIDLNEKSITELQERIRSKEDFIGELNQRIENKDMIIKNQEDVIKELNHCIENKDMIIKNQEDGIKELQERIQLKEDYIIELNQNVENKDLIIKNQENSIKELQEKNTDNENRIEVLSKNLNELREVFNSIINSKTWRLKTLFDKVLRR